MFQTFTANKLADIGPSHQDYLLQPDELLSMFKDFGAESYCDESRMSTKGSSLRAGLPGCPKTNRNLISPNRGNQPVC